MPPSCALLGGFAIDVRVALLWQHNAKPSYKLACTARCDNKVRTRNVSECSVLAVCLVRVVFLFSMQIIVIVITIGTRRMDMDEHHITVP